MNTYNAFAFSDIFYNTDLISRMAVLLVQNKCHGGEGYVTIIGRLSKLLRYDS